MREKETWEMRRSVRADSKECRSSLFWHTVLWVCHSKWQPLVFLFSELDRQLSSSSVNCRYNTSMKQPLKSYWNLKWSCNLQYWYCENVTISRKQCWHTCLKISVPQCDPRKIFAQGRPKISHQISHPHIQKYASPLALRPKPEEQQWHKFKMENKMSFQIAKLASLSLSLSQENSISQIFLLQ